MRTLTNRIITLETAHTHTHTHIITYQLAQVTNFKHRKLPEER